MKENLSEVGKAHEKELEDMNAANAVLKAQLEKALAEVKDLQQQIVDKQAEIAVLKEEVSGFEKKIRELRKNEDEIREQLEACKVETASIKAFLQPKDAQVDELKRRPAGMEEELEKTRDVEKETKNELEALHKNSSAIIKQLQEAEAALKRCVQSCQSQHDENDNLKRSMAEVFNEFEPFRKNVAAMHKTLQEAEVALNQSVESFQGPIQRAIKLTKVLHDELFRSSFTVHECISTASVGTTVGISFNDKDASVTACMVGGPAFNSKQVHQNDVIIAIDGEEVKGPEILGLLIGNDKPGSVVELTLKRASVGLFYFAFSVL
jgi:predicted  nucleic acid-binding Zn-ribbon protein